MLSTVAVPTWAKCLHGLAAAESMAHEREFDL
jgi:hypothetical protein